MPPNPDDISSLSAFVAELRQSPPCDVEKGDFEVKSWCNSARELWKLVVDAVVCLTNGDGGILLVGPEDKQTIDTTPCCPHPGVTPQWVREQIRKYTHPPIECSAYRLGDLLGLPPGNVASVITVFVPRKTILGMHTTHAGLCFVRHEDHCEIDYRTTADDYTATAVDSASLDDLSKESLHWAFQNSVVRPRTSLKWRQSRRRVEDLLVDFNLVQTTDTGTPRISLACVLLFGDVNALSPQADGAFLRITVLEKENLAREPHTVFIEQNIVDSMRDIWTHQGQVWSYLADIIPGNCLRELLVNAFIHRDYRTGGPINIRYTHEEVLEIQNAGGFCPGLRPNNLIHGNPVHRNRLLSEAAALLGYCEKSGSGIDIVYKDSVVAGYDFPHFEGDTESFTAIIPLERHSNFANFIARRSREFQKLESLLMVRHLYKANCSDLDTLASVAQRPKEYTADIARDLCRRQILRRTGDFLFELSDSVREDIEHPYDPGQGVLFGDVP
jgi:ATP-dependent DNA helicase RecG